MANWEKLNKKYFDLIESFTDLEWDTWMDTRAAKKSMRELELNLKASLAESKLTTSTLWSELYSGTAISSQENNVKKVSVKSVGITDSDCKYALAA